MEGCINDAAKYLDKMPEAYENNDDQLNKMQETPQDRGEPSPVPYSIIIQSPSLDLPQSGTEKIYLTAAVKDLNQTIETIKPYFQAVGFESFIKAVFNSGLYRLEMVIGGLSIKIYKHPNNP